MLDEPLSPDNISRINKLLGYLHDSYKGYQESAEVIKDSPEEVGEFSLRARFIAAAKSRDEMIKALEKILIRNNEPPKQTGTVGGAAHRLFLDLKALVMGKDRAAVLKEVERGEKTLIHAYNETIAEMSDLEVRKLLQQQLESIQDDFAKWQQIG